MCNDSFLAVTAMPKIFWDESQKVFKEKEAPPEAAKAPPAKKGTVVDEAPEEEEPPEEIIHYQEADLLIDGAYCDQKEKLKSLNDIMRSLPEEHFFYQRRSNLSIYRFEDVIFYLFPHMATHKRKAANTREIWINNDPFAKQSFANVPTMKDGALGMTA
jgi:hypothetical protein